MDEISDLDDAIIEDTCHCQCCSVSFVLRGNDYVIVEVEQRMREDDPRVAQLTLCMECAAATAKAYRQTLEEEGLCEHGVSDGVWCHECN